jgi:uncharacterized Tic20 family protein
MNAESQEEANWGMAAHLAAFAAFTLIPGANALGPLAVWLAKKDAMPFVADQGKEALNFNITVLVALVVGWILTFVKIGYLLLAVVAVSWLVLTILACIESHKGVAYRYPFTLRLVK